MLHGSPHPCDLHFLSPKQFGDLLCTHAMETENCKVSNYCGNTVISNSTRPLKITVILTG